MKIGILVSMMNNFGEKGFYNSQEIGLAKALAKQDAEVIVYKFLPKSAELPENVCKERIYIRYFLTKAFGISGIVKLDVLDKDLDVLLYFSDTQLSLPSVNKWCKKNNVRLVPYIGVIESHSTNKYVKKIMDILFLRNLSVYKKINCLVKNNDVKRRLAEKGVLNTTFAPVGIDLDLVNKDFEKSDKNVIKRKYGFSAEDKVMLFIGRLEEEKRPLDLIDYFAEIKNNDNNYKILIVGKGSFYEKMQSAIKEYNLSQDIVYIEKIPNDEIWELYRIADCFVNLNKQEIFGMVLLEAMYYKTKIVAWHAPGPDYIIEDKKSGYLVNTKEEFIACVCQQDLEVCENAQKRLIEELTWNNTANVIKESI